jgi:hypothetical protein
MEYVLPSGSPFFFAPSVVVVEGHDGECAVGVAEDGIYRQWRRG